MTIPMDESLILDDTCLTCDSWNIKMTIVSATKVVYVCNDCGYEWSSDDEF